MKAACIPRFQTASPVAAGQRRSSARTPGWPTGGCLHTSGEGQLGCLGWEQPGTPLLPTGLKGGSLGVAPGTPCPRVGAGQAQCRLRSRGASQAAWGGLWTLSPLAPGPCCPSPWGQRPRSPHQLLGEDGGGGRGRLQGPGAPRALLVPNRVGSERRRSQPYPPPAPRRRPNADPHPCSERGPYCVDENTERRNHYLDLAGIENYASKFGPGESRDPAPGRQA